MGILEKKLMLVSYLVGKRLSEDSAAPGGP
jgi:hypothetical protein